MGYIAEADASRRALYEALTHDIINERELQALLKGSIVNDSNEYGDQQIITGLKLFLGRKIPWWGFDPKFSHILHGARSASIEDTTESGAVNMGKPLREAKSIAEASGIVWDALVHKVSQVSMKPIEVQPDKPLTAYGLDSLVSVDLRNWMASDVGANVPLLELMDSPSVAALARLGISLSTFVDQALFAAENEVWRCFRMRRVDVVAKVVYLSKSCI